MVVGTFPTVSETFIVNQIISLINAGNEVCIFAYKGRGIKHLHKTIIDYGLQDRVHYFQSPSKSKVARYLQFVKWCLKNLTKIRWAKLSRTINPFIHGKKVFDLHLFFESQWFLVGGKFDIIHVHFGHNAERVAKLKAKKILDKIKLITTFHGFDLIPNNIDRYSKVYRNLLIESDAFTVNSIYLKNILSELNINGVCTYILPVGLDTNYFKRSGGIENIDTFKMLFCGRLIKLKGPDIAIDIFNELIRRGYENVKLNIIGEGVLKNEIIEKIKYLGIEDRVSILGACPQKFIKQKLNESHVLLMPGIHDPITKRAETQGLVLQEAQAMEVPVVLSDVGGMKYGVIDKKTGYIVKEGDVKAFADAVENLIRDRRLVVNMGNEGRRYVTANFDNKILADKLLAIYKAL